MSRRPPTQDNPQNTVYRQMHQAGSVMSQGTEWYESQIQEKDRIIQQQQQAIDDLQKKVGDLQPNLKKVPNNTETKKRLLETIEVLPWIILPVLGAIAFQNYKNHGCLKRLEGKLDEHLRK